MRRLFWLGMGATIGVLVVRRVTKTAQSFTPAGLSSSLADALNNLAAAVRDFAVEVREGMNEREQELRSGVGIDGVLGAMPQDFEGEPGRH